MRIALAVFATVVVASVVLLAAVHVDDRFEVRENAGAWMGLAHALDEGTLYPPLFEDGFYGGTRYMPVPILAYGGGARLTGEFLVSGKLVAALFGAALFVLLFVVLRQRGSPLPLAAALVASVLATAVGVIAVASIHFDAPSVLFQLAAVALVDRSDSRRATVGAGLLCTLGVLSKLSAIWAPVAIALWLLLRTRRRLPVFAAAFGVSLVVSLAVFEVLSSGRMSANLLELGATGYTGPQASDEQPASLGLALDQLRTYLPERAAAVLVLLPAALIAAAVRLARREPSVFELAFLVELPLIVLVMSDDGADYNHLLDLAVLTAVVAAGCWTLGRREGRVALVLLLLAGGVYSFVDDLLPETRYAVRSAVGRGTDVYTADPLRGHVQDDASLLSEDPSLPVLRGERPVVLDTFMFLRLVPTHPGWRRALEERVARREFDVVVLTAPLRQRFLFGHFGRRINAQLGRSYRFDEQVGPFWLYARTT